MKLINKTRIHNVPVYVVKNNSERHYRGLTDLFNISVLGSEADEVIFTTKGNEVLLDKYLLWIGEGKTFNFDHMKINAETLTLEYRCPGTTNDVVCKSLPNKVIEAIIRGKSHYEIRKLLQGVKNG